MSKILESLTALRAKPGYQYLPGGLVMVWGTTTVSLSTGAVTTNFPALPTPMTQVLNIQLTAGASAAAHFPRLDTSPTVTGFTSSVWNTSGQRVADSECYYCVIGKT